jgi:hypothetical protein
MPKHMDKTVRFRDSARQEPDRDQEFLMHNLFEAQMNIRMVRSQMPLHHRALDLAHNNHRRATLRLDKAIESKDEAKIQSATVELALRVRELDRAMDRLEHFSMTLDMLHERAQHCIKLLDEMNQEENNASHTGDNTNTSTVVRTINADVRKFDRNSLRRV